MNLGAVQAAPAKTTRTMTRFRVNDNGLEIGRKNYEVYICKQVGEDPDDYETIDVECAIGYSDAIKKAKSISQMKDWRGTPILETHVVCYTATDYTDYEPLYHRVYRNGEYHCTME